MLEVYCGRETQNDTQKNTWIPTSLFKAKTTQLKKKKKGLKSSPSLTSKQIPCRILSAWNKNINVGISNRFKGSALCWVGWKKLLLTKNIKSSCAFNSVHLSDQRKSYRLPSKLFAPECWKTKGVVNYLTTERTWQKQLQRTRTSWNKELFKYTPISEALLSPFAVKGAFWYF